MEENFGHSSAQILSVSVRMSPANLEECLKYC